MKKAIIIGAIVGTLVSFIRFETYDLNVQVETTKLDPSPTILTENIETESILYEEVIEE